MQINAIAPTLVCIHTTSVEVKYKINLFSKLIAFLWEIAAILNLEEALL
jgi:hypothetical protein